MRRTQLLASLLMLLALPLATGATIMAPSRPRAASLPLALSDLPRLRVVGLGDSVTAGSDCDCADFVRQYAAQITARTGHQNEVVNLGAAGQTITGLQQQLTADPNMRRAVAASDVVVVTIGANDLSPALARWQADGCRPTCPTPELSSLPPALARLLATVTDVLRGSPALLLVTGYWNVFPDGMVGRQAYGPDYLRWSDGLTRAANNLIKRATRKIEAHYIDLYTPFEGPERDADPTGLLAADGDHPNAAGHQLIARALADAEPLQRGLTQPPVPRAG